LNQTGNVFHEVFFRPSRADQRREELPGRHMQIAKQPERAVTNVFILAASEHARLGKEIARDPLKSLDAGLFVDGNGVNAAGAMKFEGFAIDAANFDNLSVPSLLIVNLGKQPILIAMRLYVGPILKKNRHNFVKYSARCFA
jgi:hypothetical protein